MIDFACKKFDLDEVIRCSLALTKTEFKVLVFLLDDKDNKEFTAHQIFAKFKIGLSTTQRAIKKLGDECLIKRSQRNLSKGGYVFIYSVKDREIINKKIMNILHNWIKKVEIEMKKW